MRASSENEGALRLGNLTKLPVEIFNGVGRINQFSDFGRVFEHRGELVPVDPPGFQVALFIKRAN